MDEYGGCTKLMLSMGDAILFYMALQSSKRDTWIQCKYRYVYTLAAGNTMLPFYRHSQEVTNYGKCWLVDKAIFKNIAYYVCIAWIFKETDKKKIPAAYNGANFRSKSHTRIKPADSHEIVPIL